jgi:hypothetical protein
MYFGTSGTRSASSPSRTEEGLGERDLQSYTVWPVWFFLIQSQS